jgi:endonuclease/exonuclease/phosphatase family metal-dependent hydrolase
MKIASWNIAGCHKFKGRIEDASSYDEQDFNYFAEILEKTKTNFIALQESFSFPDGGISQTEQFAVKLGYKNWSNHAYGDSHYNDNKKLSLGNITNLPVEKTYFHLLPNPNISVTRPNGQVWISFDVGFLVSQIEYESRKVNIANCHLVPLHYFKKDFIDSEFIAVREDISKFALELSENPTILLGDFNYANLQKVLPMIYENGYKDAFSAETAPGKGQQDHIVFSKHWNLKKYQVLKFEADHYLCEAELSL